MRNEYYNKTELKQLGFTDLIIQKLNIEPDDSFKNYYGYITYCYLKEKINAIVESETFKTLVAQKRHVSKESVQKAIETKKQKLLDLINSIQITVKKVPNVLREAIDSYNNFHESLIDEDGEPLKGYDNRASYDDDEEFLDRITLNYIRHNLTEYDESLSLLIGKVGKEEAYRLLNKRVTEAIKQVYPEYFGE